MIRFYMLCISEKKVLKGGIKKRVAYFILLYIMVFNG